MTRRLEGKVAVVTGSGQGVGRGIAIVLAREGARVVTNNRKPGSTAEVKDTSQFDEVERQKLLALKGDAESTANQIIRAGGEAVPFYGNVADFDTAGRLIQTALDAFGRIDILVNNAAGLGSGNLTATTEESWDYQTVPKLKGAFNTMRHAVPIMIEQKFGRVVNVASDAWIGMPGLAAYSAANAGLVGLTKATARELFQMNVTVNAICPQAASPGHFVEYTAMIKKLKAAGVKIDEAMLKKVEDAHGPAEDMAPFVAYLATQEANFISGSVFSVTADGRVTLYAEPVPAAEIKKNDGPWTVEELIGSAPETLFKGYTSIAAKSMWG